MEDSTTEYRFRAQGRVLVDISTHGWPNGCELEPGDYDMTVTSEPNPDYWDRDPQPWSHRLVICPVNGALGEVSWVSEHEDRADMLYHVDQLLGHVEPMEGYAEGD